MDVTEHEARFGDVITVGLELCRQTSREEAMALQHRIDALKMRYGGCRMGANRGLGFLRNLADNFASNYE